MAFMIEVATDGVSAGRLAIAASGPPMAIDAAGRIITAATAGAILCFAVNGDSLHVKSVDPGCPAWLGDSPLPAGWTVLEPGRLLRVGRSIVLAHVLHRPRSSAIDLTSALSSPSVSIAQPHATGRSRTARLVAIAGVLAAIGGALLFQTLAGGAAAKSRSTAATAQTVVATPPAAPPSTAIPAPAPAPSGPPPVAAAEARRGPPASERIVAKAIFAGDYARASEASDSLAAAHPEDERYTLMQRVLRSKAARTRSSERR